MTIPNFAGQKLKSMIERVERLEAEKAAIADDIREIYKEAKSHGFDTKIMRKAVLRRKLTAAQREEESALLDLYLSALEAMPAQQTAQAAE